MTIKKVPAKTRQKKIQKLFLAYAKDRSVTELERQATEFARQNGLTKGVSKQYFQALRHGNASLSLRPTLPKLLVLHHVVGIPWPELTAAYAGVEVDAEGDAVRPEVRIALMKADQIDALNQELRDELKELLKE